MNSGKCCIRVAVLLFSSGWLAQSAILSGDKPLWDPESKNLETSEASEESSVLGLPAMGEEFNFLEEWHFPLINKDLHNKIGALRKSIESRDYKEALITLDKLPAASINLTERIFLKAKLLIAVDDPQSAIQALDNHRRVEEMDKPKLELLKGLAYLDLEQWEKALAALSPLTDLVFPLDNVLLQVVYKSQEAPKPMGLEELLRKSNRSSSSAVQLRDASAIFLNLKEYEHAENLAAQAVEIDPEYANALFMLGSARINLDRPKEAMKALLAGLKIEPNNPSALSDLAVLEHKQGDSLQALGRLVQALDMNPDFRQGWGNYLTILSEALIPREGIENLLSPPENIVVSPAKWHWEQGVAGQKKGKALLAVRHLLRSLSLDLNDANAHNDLALTLIQADRKVFALPFLKAALFLTDGAPLVKENLTLIQSELLQEALTLQIAQLTDKIKKSDTASDREALANLFLEFGKLDEALEQIQHAVKAEPENVSYLIKRAQILFRLEKPEEAIDVYQTVLKLEPDNAKYNYRMAWLLLEQPDPEFLEIILAENLIRRACEITGYKQKDCLELLVRALLSKDDKEEAAAIQEKIDALNSP